MKKTFNYPSISVRSLSPENEIMGVFSLSAEATQGKRTVLTDTKSKAEKISDEYYSWLGRTGK